MSDCIFCKIVEGTIPSKKVYEDDTILAFRDLYPQAPVHILLIPKEHYPTVQDLPKEKLSLMADLHGAAQQIAIQEGLADTGYRLINNCGKDSGQEVFHIHYHLVGGHSLGPLLPRG